MHIKTRLISVYIGIAMLFSLIGLYGVQYTYHVGELFEGIETDSVPSLISLSEIIAATRQASIKAMEYSMRGNPNDKKKTIEALEKIENGLALYKKTTLNQMPAKEQNLDAKINHYKQLINSYLSIGNAQSMSKIIVDIDKLHEFRSDFIHTLNEAIQHEPEQYELILQHIKSEARKVSIKTLEFALHGDIKDKKKAEDANQNLNKKLHQYQHHPNTSIEFRQRVINKGEAYARAARQYQKEILASKVSIKDIYGMEKQVHQVRRELIHILYPLIEIENREFLDAAKETHTSISNASYILMASIALVILISLTAGILVGRSITKPIHRLNKAAYQIANGDLNQKLTTQSTDEIGELTASFDNMREKLKRHQHHMEELVEERTIDLKSARDEAERANQVKSEFLSNMSHELRTPLNAILGFAQLLEMNEKDEAKKTNLHEILDAGYHLLELVNDILDLAKIESGKMELSIQSYNLDILLNNCLSIITPLANKSSVQIENKINSSLDISIEVDDKRFKQIILNFLSNAIKYNSVNGKVTIDYSTTEGNMLLLSVIDTGHGLTSEQQENVFEIFNRLDANHSNIEGTGLGLAISKQLIEKMNGTIGVDSEIGKGSHFWIQVPLA